MNCNQCQMLSINGVPCHETGCSNSRKTWDEDRQKWILYLECRECGCDVEEGTVCSCQEPLEGEPEPEDSDDAPTLGRCECSDHACPVHRGKSSCSNQATTILYRVDMEDRTGSAFCEQCATDAFESGLFTDERD